MFGLSHEADDKYLPMLLRAARRGDVKTVAQLLAEHPEMVDEVDDGGQTLAHYAARGGQLEVLTRLLAHKPALIDIFDNFTGWIPLHAAAAAGHGEVVALLLAHKPELIDVVDKFYGRNALHYAAIGGHEHIVEQLFALRPSLIDAKTLDFGMTALHLAAGNDHDGLVTKLLVLRPSLCDMKSWKGCTALHLAAQRGHEKMVERLLAFSPHPLEKSSCTPLLHAASGGQAKVVAQLLAYDPTLIDARDSNESNALHIAVRQGREDVVALLLAHSPELIDSENSFGKGTAHLAALAPPENSVRIMSQLIAIRPSLVHRVDSDGRTALFYGASQDELVELLLPLAPEQVFLKDLHGNTLLHLTKPRRKGVVEKVWRMNPEALHAVNANGHTPFQNSKSYETAFEFFQWKFPMDDIVQVLLQRGSREEALKKIRPLVVGECNGPLMECLHQDLVDTVQEYLGFERCTRKRKPEE